MVKKLTIDLESYVKYVRAIGRLSRLFSDNDAPYVDSRFVERLYIANTGAKDLSRSDVSYDAKHLDEFGVGIKTFLASSANSSKREKVAEFTRHANLGAFTGLNPKNLALKVAQLRNARIAADAMQYGLEVESSIYHCLVRIKGACFVIEEPYSLIDLDNLAPTDRNGNVLGSWKSNGGTHYFTDGQSNYTFNSAKSVLIKQFDWRSGKPITKSKIFGIEILDNPLTSLLEAEADIVNTGGPINEFHSPEEENKYSATVALPLYSKQGGRHVPAKSGINQWNAGGRARSFGEAYIPIPATIHNKFPDFFPDRDVSFVLRLPNGKSVEAKVCQAGRKALMSKHNADLVEWLYEIIDGTLAEATKRFASGDVYTYDDLVNIGKDSVIIRKLAGKKLEYEIELAPLNFYEEFAQEL